MSEDKSTPILAPTYQTVIINALNTAVTRMLNSEPEGTFYAFVALHAILKPAMQLHIKEPWDKYLDGKTKIKVTEGSYAKRNLRLREYIRFYLSKNNPAIMQHFIATLDKYGYLTRDYRPLSAKDFEGMSGEESVQGESK